MRVCLDIQSALAQRAGVGRYTRMLGEALAEQRAGDDLCFAYFDFKRKGCDFAPAGVRQHRTTWIPGRFVQAAWKRIGFPPFDWFSGPADVFHFPNFIRPPLTRGRSVVTIHDASFMRHPDTLEDKNYRYLRKCIRDTVERADAVICVSQFTADELASLMSVPRTKLKAIHSGLPGTMRRASPDGIAAVRRKHGLHRPYLLSVGTVEPRKNYPFLVDVFEQLDFEGDLVIAGMHGWKYERFFERVAGSKRRDRIKLLEYVAEEDLPALYSGAELFLITSLYEGFGFTPLEAMQCETPVISAATGSLPEVLGDGAMLVDHFDIDAWKSAIMRLACHADERSALAARGLARTRRFTWTEAARQTWSVYRSLA